MTVSLHRKRGAIVYGSGYVDVELSASELIEQLSDDDILAEVEERKLGPKAKMIDPLQDFAEEALEALQRGDPGEAKLILERALRPKFSTLKICEEDYKKARAPVIKNEGEQHG